MMPNYWEVSPSIWLAIGFVLLFISWKLWVLPTKADLREPPVVTPRVPFVGHVWGLMRYAHDYLNHLHCQNALPICTLPMLGRKVYVINSPALVQAAFSNPDLSFGPFVKDFVSRMDELSPAARQAYIEEGMHTRVMQIFSTYMSGASLKRMNAVLLNELILSLPVGGSEVQADSLWVWLRNALTVGSTSMLLGTRHNPFKENASLIDAYWKYEAGDPSRRYNVTAVGDRSTSENHSAMLSALTAYFLAGHDLQDEDVAQMTRETTRLQRERGFNPVDLAAAQVVIIHGSLVSAVPTVFWLVAHVFSNPELLTRLREEVLAAVTIAKDEESGLRQVLITTDRIESRCPTLTAAFREAQRLAAVGTLHRRVLNDTEIAATVGGERKSYLLKKGTAVLVPVIPSHRNHEAWGEAVDEFNVNRFLSEDMKGGPNTQNEGGSTKKVAMPRKKAYFPFGGGRELCPGRNFATAEALGTLVVLVLGFDISAPDGSMLKLPPVGFSKMTSQTARPLETADLRANVKRRQGWENVIWGVDTS